MNDTDYEFAPARDNVSELGEALRMVKETATTMGPDASRFSIAFAATNALSMKWLGHPMFYLTEPPKNLGGVMVRLSFSRRDNQTVTFESILATLKPFYWAEGIFYQVDENTMVGTGNDVWLWFDEKFTETHAGGLAGKWSWTVVSDEPAVRPAVKRVADSPPETPTQIIDRLTRRRIAIETDATDAAVAERKAIDDQIAALLK